MCSRAVERICAKVVLWRIGEEKTASRGGGLLVSG
jgi:hypothetical protein